MLPYPLLIAAMLVGQISLAQIKPVYVHDGLLPDSLRPAGAPFGTTMTWQSGDTTHFVTATAINEPDDSVQHTARPRVIVRYSISVKQSTRLIWEDIDADSCSTDNYAEIRSGSLQVTDRDKDGHPEIWWMYTIGCSQHYAPQQLQLVMYEGASRHSIKGRSLVPYPVDQPVGGEFAFDDAFKRTPRSIRRFARQLWSEHKLDIYTD